MDMVIHRPQYHYRMVLRAMNDVAAAVVVVVDESEEILIHSNDDQVQIDLASAI